MMQLSGEGFWSVRTFRSIVYIISSRFAWVGQPLTCTISGKTLIRLGMSTSGMMERPKELMMFGFLEILALDLLRIYLCIPVNSC